MDYFIKRQHLISPLIAGDELIVNNYECLNSNNQSVIKFSKQFINQIELLNKKNYKLKKAKVNFIIYWLKENTETEIKIILPEIYFEKTETSLLPH